MWWHIYALDDFETELDAVHRTAVDAVQGAIAPYADSAADAAYHQSHRVRETVDFARGVLGWDALAIDDFNLYSSDPRSIAKLNAFYREQAID